MTILENLYYGNIDPHEYCISNDSHFSKIIKRSNKLSEQLTDQLTEKQKSLFNDYCESQANLYETSEKEAFIRGFKLGLRFMAEAVVDLNEEFEV